MRETSFIQQNKDKWRQFEQIMESPRKDPDKLNDLFVQITDDLSYSRTFYPNRSVRVYLNGLAQRIFFSIYKNRRSRANRLFTFWSDELPQLIYEARGEFRMAFLIFLLACLIGGVSSAMDEQFANVILGDAYVDMTLENIESGDPMAVYKEKGAFGMTLGIAMNNLFVAFLTFVMGAFFTLGTMAILIRNGIMLGAFQWFFIERGLFWDSFLTIWIHGTLEISAIIIAGAAGLTLGKGLAFPGTYTRGQAFQQSARRGIQIMIGIVPIIILAGIFEGFLTRHTETPDVVRGAFILACLAFVLTYFVWYPRYKARRGFAAPTRETRIPPSREQRIDVYSIKNAGELFSEVFVFYKKRLGAITLAVLGTTALYTLVAFLTGTGNPSERFYFPSDFFGTAGELGQFFYNPKVPLLPLANVLVMSILAYFAFYNLLRVEGSSRSSWQQHLYGFLKVAVAMAALELVLWTNDWYTPFLLLGLIAVPLVWGFAALREGANAVTAFGRALGLIGQSYGKALGLFLILMTVGYLFFALVDSALGWFYLDLITWVVHLSEAAMAELSAVVLTFVSIFILHLIYVMLFIGGGLLYYTLREAREAPALMDRIGQIRLRRNIKGLEQE
ncbi:MAG: stage II sporulation protein M [Lewinellaceae bacterium]|nr:stage II sporulation protein M [Lewinellaceae bacterium]